MTCAESKSPGIIETLADSYDETQADELASLFLSHARVEDATQEGSVVPRYLRAAVNAAESYTNRDIFRRARQYRVREATFFRFTRGPASSIVVKDSAGSDVSASLTLLLYGGPKGSGFLLDLSTVSQPATIDLVSGFESLDEMPQDLLAFILQAAGAFYEMREVLNYSAMVQHADQLPMYLLDAWRVPGMA